eukprot:TRINITY_DN11616_c0_g2_i1.p1 TRINITY_DN11616_c0_g2~~TRINITY_DN11616_c0_g2_i1.p1  ORF type:complete len:1615 (-),score=324.29 TRINITY_DN11616_c0_g2_i1:1826-6670(-)
MASKTPEPDAEPAVVQAAVAETASTRRDEIHKCLAQCFEEGAESEEAVQQIFRRMIGQDVCFFAPGFDGQVKAGMQSAFVFRNATKVFLAEFLNAVHSPGHASAEGDSLAFEDDQLDCDFVAKSSLRDYSWRCFVLKTPLVVSDSQPTDQDPISFEYALCEREVSIDPQSVTVSIVDPQPVTPQAEYDSDSEADNPPAVSPTVATSSDPAEAPALAAPPPASVTLPPLVATADQCEWGLALSGGGGRSLATCAGVIEALSESGVEISDVSAVSGGAIAGSAWIDWLRWATKKAQPAVPRAEAPRRFVTNVVNHSGYLIDWGSRYMIADILALCLVCFAWILAVSATFLSPAVLIAELLVFCFGAARLNGDEGTGYTITYIVVTFALLVAAFIALVQVFKRTAKVKNYHSCALFFFHVSNFFLLIAMSALLILGTLWIDTKVDAFADISAAAGVGITAVTFAIGHVRSQQAGFALLALIYGEVLGWRVSNNVAGNPGKDLFQVVPYSAVLWDVLMLLSCFAMVGSWWFSSMKQNIMAAYWRWRIQRAYFAPDMQNGFGCSGIPLSLLGFFCQHKGVGTQMSDIHDVRPRMHANVTVHYWMRKLGDAAEFQTSDVMVITTASEKEAVKNRHYTFAFRIDDPRPSDAILKERLAGTLVNVDQFIRDDWEQQQQLSSAVLDVSDLNTKFGPSDPRRLRQLILGVLRAHIKVCENDGARENVAEANHPSMHTGNWKYDHVSSVVHRASDKTSHSVIHGPFALSHGVSISAAAAAEPGGKHQQKVNHLSLVITAFGGFLGQWVGHGLNRSGCSLFVAIFSAALYAIYMGLCAAAGILYFTNGGVSSSAAHYCIVTVFMLSAVVCVASFYFDEFSMLPPVRAVKNMLHVIYISEETKQEHKVDPQMPLNRRPSNTRSRHLQPMRAGPAEDAAGVGGANDVVAPPPLPDDPLAYDDDEIQPETRPGMPAHTAKPPQNVYLTDGGHLENLGWPALLRVHHPRIISVDATEDASYQFESLFESLHYARVHLNCSFTIGAFNEDVESYVMQRFREQLQTWQPGHSFPTLTMDVFYKDTATYGKLLYIKLPMYKDVAMGVSGAACTCCHKFQSLDSCFGRFPHHKTAFQFFTRAQFDAYRVAGFDATIAALKENKVINPNLNPMRMTLEDARPDAGTLWKRVTYLMLAVWASALLLALVLTPLVYDGYDSSAGRHAACAMWVIAIVSQVLLAAILFDVRSLAIALVACIPMSAAPVAVLSATTSTEPLRLLAAGVFIVAVAYIATYVIEAYWKFNLTRGLCIKEPNKALTLFPSFSVSRVWIVAFFTTTVAVTCLIFAALLCFVYEQANVGCWLLLLVHPAYVMLPLFISLIPLTTTKNFFPPSRKDRLNAKLCHCSAPTFCKETVQCNQRFIKYCDTVHGTGRGLSLFVIALMLLCIGMPLLTSSLLLLLRVVLLWDVPATAMFVPLWITALTAIIAAWSATVDVLGSGHRRHKKTDEEIAQPQQQQQPRPQELQADEIAPKLEVDAAAIVDPALPIVGPALPQHRLHRQQLFSDFRPVYSPAATASFESIVGTVPEPLVSDKFSADTLFNAWYHSLMSLPKNERFDVNAARFSKAMYRWFAAHR